MASFDAEKRKSKRTYFTATDGVFAVIELPGPDKMSLSTNLLSLSEGGISFIAQRENNTMEKGAELLLVRVFEPQELSFLHELPVEICHIIEDDELPHVVCGCQFKSIPETLQVKIREFLATR